MQTSEGYELIRTYVWHRERWVEIYYGDPEDPWPSRCVRSWFFEPWP